MRTKRCYDCRQFKRVELFDIDRHRPSDGCSAQCKACRRQRQNRGGYGICRNRALVEPAARHPDQYRRYREQARAELAPDTAPVQVWDRARALALAELSRRHHAELHQRYQQLRAAHPTWSSGRVLCEATNQQRRARHAEFRELLTGYAGARLAGRRLVNKMTRRAQRLLQLAYPEEYHALYAAERAKIGNPVQQQPAAPQAGQRGAPGSLPAAIGQPGGPR